MCSCEACLVPDPSINARLGGGFLCPSPGCKECGGVVLPTPLPGELDPLLRELPWQVHSTLPPTEAGEVRCLLCKHQLPPGYLARVSEQVLVQAAEDSSRAADLAERAVALSQQVIGFRKVPRSYCK